MKNSDETPMIEPRTLALILGTAVGLGIVVHEVFFLVGALIAFAVAGESVAHAARKHLHTGGRMHRHP